MTQPTPVPLDSDLSDPVAAINAVVTGLRADLATFRDAAATANDQLSKATDRIKALQAQIDAMGPPFRTGASSNTWPTLEHLSGPQSVARVYDGGFNKSFPAVCAASGVSPIGKTVVYSCKAPAGLRSSDVAALLASVPPDVVDVIFEFQHEASNPIKSFTTAAARAALLEDKRMFYGMVLEAGFHTIWIEMDYLWQNACAKAHPWRTPANFNPGDDLITYYGVDTYNNGSLLNPQRWDSYGYAIGDPQPGESLAHVGGGYVEGGFIAYAKAHHKPWIVTEWNSIRNLNAAAGSSTKAAYLKTGADYFRTKGAAGVLLFDCKGRTSAVSGESWQLSNDPTGADYAAWATVTASSR